MKNTDDIHTVANGSALSRAASDRLRRASGGWSALQFEFDGRDIDLLHDIVEALGWQKVAFGYTIEATIRCRDISDLVTLRLVDPGEYGLKWHPVESTASCHPCLDPAGLMAFVDDFTPDATVDFAGNAIVEFADFDVLDQLLAPAALQFDPPMAFVFWLFISNVIQILLMPLIMVGQNLQASHAELRAEHDLEVNVKAEQEIETILRHLEYQNSMLIAMLEKLGVSVSEAGHRGKV